MNFRSKVAVYKFGPLATPKESTKGAVTNTPHRVPIFEGVGPRVAHLGRSVDVHANFGAFENERPKKDTVHLLSLKTSVTAA